MCTCLNMTHIGHRAYAELKIDHIFQDDKFQYPVLCIENVNGSRRINGVLVKHFSISNFTMSHGKCHGVHKFWY